MIRTWQSKGATITKVMRGWGGDFFRLAFYSGIWLAAFFDINENFHLKFTPCRNIRKSTCLVFCILSAALAFRVCILQV